MENDEQQIEWIEIPYYREMMLDYPNINSFTKEPDTFYTPYQIFCLKTRLSPIVYDLYGPLVSMNFVCLPVYATGRMQLYMRLITNNEDEVVPIENGDYYFLKNEIQKVTTQYHNYCLLFETGRSFPFSFSNSFFNSDFEKEEKENYLPSMWMRSLFENPDFFNYLNEIIPFDLLYQEKEGFLFIKLPNIHSWWGKERGEKNDDFEYLYDESLKQIEHLLWDLWQKGTLVLSSTKDKKFIKEWNLEKIFLSSKKDFVLDVNKKKDFDLNNDLNGDVYQAKWEEKRIQTNMTQFLFDVFLNEDGDHVKTLEIPISSFLFENNWIEKHYIALQFLKMKSEMIPIFYENKIIITVHNYYDLVFQLNTLFQARFIFSSSLKKEKEKVIVRSLSIYQDYSKLITQWDQILKENKQIQYKSSIYYATINGKIIYSVLLSEEQNESEIYKLWDQIQLKGQ